MRIYPAIDLLDGKVVRLREGRREAATFYDVSPVEVARRFVAAGARRLHVVDLDGAFAGAAQASPSHAAVQQLLGAGLPLQLGGGVRSLAALERLLDEARVERVVLGTVAVKEPALVRAACARWPERVVVAVDARDGKVAVEGWVEATDLSPLDVAAEAAEAGAAAILFTDIRRDGTGDGPCVEETARLARTLHPVEVIASGGVGTLAHLRALALAGVPAAVVGRALHEGAFTVEEALVAAGAQD